MNKAESYMELLKRGFFNQCPQCKEGKLLRRYTTPHKECSNCQLDYEPLRADDGPAWATILIAGHLAMPFTFWVLEQGLDNLFLEILYPSLFIVFLCIVMLPRAKGIFMNIIWHIHVRKDKEDETPQDASSVSSSS